MKSVSTATEWPNPCRRGFRGHRRFNSITAIVQDYIRRHRPNAIRELQYFRNIPSLKEAIEQAGLARTPNGKRSSHQRRIPASVLQQATRRLRRANLGHVGSFAQLIARVTTATRSVHGIGELYVYDTALRLGVHLGLRPRRVYLHAGTRRGAQALGLDSRSESLSLNQLPEALRRLRPYEIEDVLCIYKDWLATAKGV